MTRSAYQFKVVQLQTTSYCNGRCVFCPYKDSWFMKNPGKMSAELYTRILSQIADMDPTFSGKFCPYMMNEPFTDDQIVMRSYEAIDTLHAPYLEISSNLYLPTHKQLDELLDLFQLHRWKGRVMVSHHGTSPTQYEATMGITYGKALDNLKYLIDKAQGRLNIYIHTATTSRDGQYAINAPNHVQRFWMDFLIDNDLSPKNINIYPLKVHSRAGNVCEWKRIVREIGPSHPFSCPRLHGHAHILYSGEVVLCCNDYQHETVMGDLTKDTLADILLHSPLFAMAKGEIESPDDFLCKRCEWVGA